VEAATEPGYDDEAIQAMVRAYVACQLALEALPRLPDELKGVVERPLNEFCAALGPVLERIKPGVTKKLED
jgi:hypothetical protein